jgi:hypothetical protein
VVGEGSGGFERLEGWEWVSLFCVFQLTSLSLSMSCYLETEGRESKSEEQVDKTDHQ